MTLPVNTVKTAEANFALSEADYAKLVEMEKTVESLVAQVERVCDERDEYKSAWNRGVDLALKKSIAFENMRKREESLRIMLGQACDEMEGIFRSTGAFASVEIATEYTVWASYLKHNYGRDDAKCIDDANDWIDEQ